MFIRLHLINNASHRTQIILKNIVPCHIVKQHSSITKITFSLWILQIHQLEKWPNVEQCNNLPSFVWSCGNVLNIHCHCPSSSYMSVILLFVSANRWCEGCTACIYRAAIIYLQLKYLFLSSKIYSTYTFKIFASACTYL